MKSEVSDSCVPHAVHCPSALKITFNSKDCRKVSCNIFLWPYEFMSPQWDPLNLLLMLIALCTISYAFEDISAVSMH